MGAIPGILKHRAESSAFSTLKDKVLSGTVEAR
jgi:hypothetical protein